MNGVIDELHGSHIFHTEDREVWQSRHGDDALPSVPSSR